MKTDIPMNGLMVKNHFIKKRDSDTLQHGEFRSNCGSRLVKFFLWISEIPEWHRVPEHRDSHASSCHEASLEPFLERREGLGKHSVKTHFP